MTLINEKVLHVLTETLSTQCCTICRAKPLQFMKVNLQFQNVEPKTLKLWNTESVSYRFGINKWQVRGSEEKAKMAARKAEIQEKLWAELGFHVLPWAKSKLYFQFKLRGIKISR